MFTGTSSFNCTNLNTVSVKISLQGALTLDPEPVLHIFSKTSRFCREEKMSPNRESRSTLEDNRHSCLTLDSALPLGADPTVASKTLKVIHDLERRCDITRREIRVIDAAILQLQDIYDKLCHYQAQQEEIVLRMEQRLHAGQQRQNAPNNGNRLDLQENSRARG